VSLICLSFNAFEMSLPIEVFDDSARDTVFSCFMIFLSSLLLPTVSEAEINPNNPATPARGAPTIIPIPLRETARPEELRRTAAVPTVADDAMNIE
jgi:hypothetical protein